VNADEPIVYVLDDDPRVREYLKFKKPDAPACLILDLDLPGMTGLELQKQLAGSDEPPIIFLTGHGDISSSVTAMKAGATEFLSKPFEEKDLLHAIDAALATDRQTRAKNVELNAIKKSYASLTPREREVLPFVVSGLLNKQTAGELGTSEITIRIHRGQIMRKMAAHSLAELVRMAAKLGIPKSGI